MKKKPLPEIKQKEIEKIIALKGRVKWTGDLKRMRRDRFGK